MSMSMSGMDMGSDSDCKVSMLWNWYTIDACFLSSSWHVESNGAFAASCIGVALLAVILELCRRLGKEYDGLIRRQFEIVAKRNSRPTIRRQSRPTPARADTGTSACGSQGKTTSIKSTNSSQIAVQTLAARNECCAVEACPSAAGAVAVPREPEEAQGIDNAHGDAERQINPRTLTFRASPLQQLVRAVIHAVTFGLAYIIMLLAMYFNGYIIISIIIGSGIGKFLCDWMVIELRVGDRLDDESVEVHAHDRAWGAKDQLNETVCCG